MYGGTDESVDVYDKTTQQFHQITDVNYYPYNNIDGKTFITIAAVGQ